MLKEKYSSSTKALSTTITESIMSSFGIDYDKRSYLFTLIDLQREVNNSTALVNGGGGVHIDVIT